MGLNGIIVFSSLIAYLVGQVIDIQIYAWIKNCTGEKHLWLRNNGSTLTSQLIDTCIVNFIHLYVGLGLSFDLVFKAMLFSYMYKAFFSMANTPLFYACVLFTKHMLNRKLIAAHAG